MDLNDVVRQLRQRNELEKQRQLQMSQMGGPTGQGGGVVQPQRVQTPQFDQGGSQQQQGNIMDVFNKMNDASGGRLGDKLGTAARSGLRSLMGSTGLPGSGSALGGSTTGTLANMGATNMGAGISPTVGAGVNFPGAAAGAGGASGAGGLGGMLGSAGSVAWPIAAVAALDKLGISSTKDTLKGRAAGNIMERIGINKTGGGAIPQMGKGIVQFMGGDFKTGWKNTADSIKNIFRLKLF